MVLVDEVGRAGPYQNAPPLPLFLFVSFVLLEIKIPC